MNTRKTTKKALFMSALSLLLCFSMLIGTTFAWFTDSVESGVNKIIVGNLDVDVYYGDPDDKNSIQGVDTLFNDVALWEPGAVAYENLTVVNLGNLALKYQLSINFDKATPNANGDTLANVLKVGFVEDGIQNTTREGVLAEVKTWLPLASFAQAGELLKGENKTYGVVIYWQPSDIDNEFNVKGGLSIDLGIKLVATQLTAESDSFGPDYDNEAVWADHYASNVAELAALIENAADGDVIALTDDIVLGNAQSRSIVQNNLVIAKGKNIILNLNGKTISLVDSVADKNGDGGFSSADNSHMFTVKGNLTVIGEGNLVMQHTGDNMAWNALSTVFSVEGGVLTLGEGVVAIHKGGTDMAYVVDVNTTGGDSILNVEGATLHSTYVGVRVFNNHKTAKGIVNYNSGVISGISRDVWTQIMSAPAANAVVNTKIPYTTNDAGDRYYFTENAVATDKDSLVAALNEGVSKIDMLGNTVNLNYGLTKAMIPEGKTVTIANAIVSGKSYGNGVDGTVIFENCVFTNTGAYSIHFDNGAGDVIFKNCTLYGWNSFGSTLNSVEFYNCSLYGNGTYGLIRSYVDLYVENCYIDTTNANHSDNYSEGVEAVAGAKLTEKNNTYVATTLAEVMTLAKKGNTTIDAKGANLGDFYYAGTFANGTVLKNAKFTYVYGASVDGVVTFENCQFVSDHSYSANFSDGSTKGKIIFNNCYFDGWSSFGDLITNVEMNGCTFDWNNPYSMLRFYQNAQLNNCTFVDIEGIDTNKTGTVVELTNCTGIEGKIYNNGSNVGTWIVNGEDISSSVTSW